MFGCAKLASISRAVANKWNCARAAEREWEPGFELELEFEFEFAFEFAVAVAVAFEFEFELDSADR